MKLVTFLHDNKEMVGVLTEDGAAVRPLPFDDMNALIQAPREALLTAVKDAAAALPLSAVHPQASAGRDLSGHQLQGPRRGGGAVQLRGLYQGASHPHLFLQARDRGCGA